MADEANEQAREIYKYARRVASDQRDVDTAGDAQYEKDLQRTIEQLEAQLKLEQQKLREAEDAADKSTLISLDQASDPVELLRQRRVITAAYKQLTNSKPDLPPKGSVLPTLIALRTASQSTVGSRALIPKAQADLKDVRKQLAAERKRLTAFQLLQRQLETRISELGAEQERQRQLSADDVARERISELRAKEDRLHEEANELGAELKWFIKEYLSPMLAVEETGGPPVGDLTDVTDEIIGAGFTNTGKMKQPKADSQELARLGKEQRTKTYNEMRKLMQDLLNASTEGDKDDADGWIEVPENSRAAQYLITAKVAMFYPDDARKIRLLDFAG